MHCFRCQLVVLHHQACLLVLFLFRLSDRSHVDGPQRGMLILPKIRIYLPFRQSTRTCCLCCTAHLPILFLFRWLDRSHADCSRQSEACLFCPNSDPPTLSAVWLNVPSLSASRDPPPIPFLFRSFGCSRREVCLLWPKFKFTHISAVAEISV